MWFLRVDGCLCWYLKKMIHFGKPAKIPELKCKIIQNGITSQLCLRIVKNFSHLMEVWCRGRGGHLTDIFLHTWWTETDQFKNAKRNNNNLLKKNVCFIQTQHRPLKFNSLYNLAIFFNFGDFCQFRLFLEFFKFKWK